MAGFVVKEDIEKVRDMANLYDIVSDDVTLKSSGSQYTGLCPFHDEKTPSFFVNPSNGFWHCFGCGKSGDVFDYVQEREGVDFREALEIVADRYHYELHYEDRSTGKRKPNAGVTRSRLLEACAEAQKFFVSQLTSKDALKARQLLDGRKFQRADCERFGCGYAPRGGSELVRYLSSKGFTIDEMVGAGLARMGTNGPYDYFRGRVTWPIRDTTGRTLGFGARKLFDDDRINAKYINTPDTKLYHKNQVLYGIDMAKESIRKTHQIVIVEGYTDVMACHLSGVTTAVATCGTAFGEEHAKIARRLIADEKLGGLHLVGPMRRSRIVFTFDGDSAGQKAALHAFGLDGQFLTQAFVAVAHDGLDPCDLRIQDGEDAVRSLINDARPLYDFVIDTVVDRFDTQYAAGKVGAERAVAPIIAQIRDVSLQHQYTRQTAGHIGVPIDDLNAAVIRERARLGVRDEDIYAQPPQRQPMSQRQAQLDAAQRYAVARSNAENQHYWRVDDTVFMTEQQFMGVVVQIPRAFDPTQFGNITERCFLTPVFRSLFQALEVAGGLPAPDAQMTQSAWVGSLVQAAGPELAPVVQELAAMPLPLSVDPQAADAAKEGVAPLRSPSQQEASYARQLLVNLLDADCMRRIAQIRSRMKMLPEGDEKFRLLGEISRIEQNRKQIQDFVFNSSVR